MLYLVALPLLIYLSFKKKYRQSIPARFFLFKNTRFSKEDGIWFHVCSLGEAKALKPVLELIKDEEVMVTTITHTGQAEAKKYDAEVRYLPYEMFLPFWIKKQKTLVVLEAEFWYMFFVSAFAKGTRVVLLNARISEKSAKKYLQFAWFYKKLLAHVDVIYAQSQADKNRFLALGAKNIEVVGNIKLAQKVVKTKEYNKPDCECVIVGASTHDGEEDYILKSFVEYRKHKDAKLIIVPRHPERFEAVYDLMKSYANQSSFSIAKFSQSFNFNADITLVDMMGELNNVYAISDVAVVCGSFKEKIGGHNPLEPAHFGCKIITGKYFHDQKELYKYVHHVQYVEPDEIHKAFFKAEELPSSRVDESIDLDEVVKKILK